MLALLCLAETVALVRVPRLAGQPRWRRWLAALPALVALLCATCAGIMVYAYVRLSADPGYSPATGPCYGYGCPMFYLGSASIQALKLAQWVNARSGLIVVMVFVVALFGYVALAIGRRRSPAAA